MQKSKIYILFILLFLLFIYSCEKKEPAVRPDPDEIMRKIAGQFPEFTETKKLPEAIVADMYSAGQNKPVDLSKIEKYIVFDLTRDGEIAIFKLYDKVNTEYVKEMAQARISKLQEYGGFISDTGLSKILNGAEIRSYGNYVYYIAHSEKDKIFEIIEKSLRGE